MSDPKNPGFGTDWNEIEPAVFERKGFSADEFAKLNQRPDGLIKAAIVAATQSRDEKNQR
jgi:hypothetical protein